MSTLFEGWHYHRSFGVVRKRNVWGMDLRKTYPIVEIALPTPPPPPTDDYYDEADLGNSVNLEDNDYYADLSFSISLDSSCDSSALPSQSTSGVNLSGLGLFGIATADEERLSGRLHLNFRDDTPAISELTLDEIYATFVPCKKPYHASQEDPISPLNQTEFRRIALTPEKLALKHSRSTISSQLKARSRPISLSSSNSSGWK
ncbi:hypothetical protein CYLTODRAFT_454570 [Cylindrobasidium torrendii FP15055 ss-10]|uniref:Uncharacterized protein n=1 Tax=Cylindrobasidium torrendii FP15055 ss-10 TaxID=1314674 RepID=A0A0D7B9W8_9AGAR|nr:hypothetical protein CYLTODRAFT_454570 [Cylindrobasidium torrendii FP15055 ss-10]